MGHTQKEYDLINDLDHIQIINQIDSLNFRNYLIASVIVLAVANYQCRDLIANVIIF